MPHVPADPRAAVTPGADAQLQALVRLAAAVAHVPSATINLFDGPHQCQPFTVGFVGADSPIAESMCWISHRGPGTRATLRPAAVVVPDAAQDPRFADNPWVDGRRARVRLYASLPLQDRTRAVVGTLCVFDESPGVLDESQLTALDDLATTAAALLDLRADARRWEAVAADSAEQRRRTAERDARLLARQTALVKAQARVADAELVPAVVMDRICRGAQDVTGGSGAALVEAYGDGLVVRAATGTLDALLGADLDAVDSLAGRALRQAGVVRAGAGDLDPAAVPESRGTGAGALLAVPLRRDGQVIGAAVVAAADADDLRTEEADALELLAAPFSAALANAWAMHRAIQDAATDPLTGLPNRAAAVLHLERALARQDRHGGHLALLFLDLNGFKGVNDTAGHGAGDAVLAEVARRLHGATRGTDVAARYGGDEFVVIAEGLDRPAVADALAARLVAAVTGDHALPDGTVARLGVAVGVAHSRATDARRAQPVVERATALLVAADAAMYADKARARRAA